MEIRLPDAVNAALQALYAAGFEAYAVGGCVRDSLLGLTPFDWDITTSALPQEIQAVFQGERTLDTGLKHGTVTVLSDGMPLEITTYRTDGAYTDNRRPDSVTFSRRLSDDLTRRDFTVNTLCYAPQTGIVDLLGGTVDLEKKILRAVGDPDKRFSEDALRIMRGIRFSAQLGFSIEEKTAESIRRNRALLKNIAAERIRVEFCKLLTGKDAARVLLSYPEVLAVFLPELTEVQNFPQNTPYHKYDVYTHSVYALKNAPPDLALRLCLFFHDFGKPACHMQDAHGIAHFKGHPEKSAALADEILRRLRFDNKTRETVCLLIRYHDCRIPETKVQAKRLLREIGAENYRRLLQVKAADESAKAYPQKKLAALKKAQALLSEILENGECYTLKQLNISGTDLQNAGFPHGKGIRTLLEALLEAVIAGECPNETDALTAFARKYDTEKSDE